jgi:hypothetical protein
VIRRRSLLALAAATAVAGCSPFGSRPASGGPGPASGGSGKRGIGTWYFDGVDRALAEADVSWYYTWSPAPGQVAGPAQAEFVPMIWGPDDLGQAGAAAGNTLLGFNEPDVTEQANLSADQALDLWPQLTATGRRLGSPAVSAGAATPGGWLDRFLAGAAGRDLRVDFVAVHWYGTNPATAVDDLGGYLRAVYDRYRRPIWLTEFALADFTHGVASAWYAPRSDQAAFAAAATALLDGLPYVERYAWFALSDRGSDFRTGLYDEQGQLTAVGDAYGPAKPG